MKKSIFLATFFSLLSTSLFAQIGGIEDSVADISDTIREYISHHPWSHLFSRLPF